MAAQSADEIAQQRDELVDKVELEVQRKVALDTHLIHYHRIILQALPFNGQPALIADEHRQAIERLVDKHYQPGYDIKIKSIIGYASSLGETQSNLQLSQQRAEEVHQYLLEVLDQQGVDHNEMLYQHVRIEGKGESDLPVPTMEESDNPLNRRVEIVYVLTITFPVPPDDAGPASTQWKIDFGPAGSGFFLSGGTGTLTMLPDGLNGPAQAISKAIRFEQLGVSLGLFGKLRKLKILKKFPLLRRLIHELHADKFTQYSKTTKVLQNVGFSVDIVNEGGEFETSLPLTFNDMQGFNYATVTAGLSILGKGEAALYLLHSEYFFAYTLILGAGQNIAVPDAELSFVPAGFVQVSLGQE